jgi:hypothetical protein
VTEKECLNNIAKFCDKELKKTSWLFIFNDHDISLEKTRLLKDYEKDANLPLPSELVFENNRIDYIGIEYKNSPYKWSDICCVVIKHDTRPADIGERGQGRFRTDKYIVFSLNNGNVFQIKVGTDEQYSNLLGHFIELYKLGK